MNPAGLLTVYSVAIVAASLLGLVAQAVFRLTHPRVQIALSFIAGLVVGMAFYHLLPHSVERISGDDPIEAAVWWMIIGMVFMILLLRVFPLYQHDSRVDDCSDLDEHVHGPQSLNWLGVSVGMSLHALTEGTALGASVQAWDGGEGAIDWLSLGVCLAIMLHKPLDAFFVFGIMRVAGLSYWYAFTLASIIALVCPLGAFLTFWGVGLLGASESDVIGRALAFGAGAMMCVSLSDLLPEIHFHRHDRGWLTSAFLIGLVLAYALHYVET